MKFHPIISIILGLFVALVLVMIPLVFDAPSLVGNAMFIFAFILGGFIATYFSKDKNIMYSIYMGLIAAVLFSIIESPDGLNKLPAILLGFIQFPGMSLIGGLPGKIDYESVKQTKQFGPIIAIIAMIAIFIIGISFFNAYY